MLRKLQDKMGGSAKPEQSKALARHNPAQLKGAIANDSGAEKRCGTFVGEYRRDRKRKRFAGESVLCISAIRMKAGELSGIAQVLQIFAAKLARTIRGVKPRHADAIAFSQIANCVTHGIDKTNDLMSGNDRQLR